MTQSTRTSPTREFRSWRKAAAGMLLAAGLLGAGLAWWASKADQQDVVRVELKPAPTVVEGLASLAPRPVDPATKQELAPNLAPDLIVRVTSSTGSPLAANVSLYRRGGVSDLIGRPIARDVLAEAKTDVSGVARFTDVKRGETGVLATATGFVPGTATTTDGQREVSLQLTEGMSISGVVRSTSGGVLSGITVVAKQQAEIGLSPTLRGDGQDPSLRSSVTSSTGRFEVAGLQEGKYSIEAFGEGWQLKSTLPKSDGLYRAGASNLELVMTPFRLVRFQLRDADSRELIAARAASLGLLGQRDIATEISPQTAWVPTSTGRIGIAKFLSSPSATVARVQLLNSESVPTELTVAVDVPGYEPAVAQLVPRTAQELLRSDVTDVVTLTPSPRTRRGSLRAQIKRDLPASIWRGESPPLLVVPLPVEDVLIARPHLRGLIDRPESGVTYGMQILGVRVEGSDGQWIFSGIPEGKYDGLRLNDGVSESLPFVAEVRAAEVGTATAAFERPTGFTLELLGPEKRSVSDAVVFIRRTDTAADASQSTTFLGVGGLSAFLVNQQGERVFAFQPLSPGSYEVIIRKPGFAVARKSFQLAPSEVAHLAVPVEIQ